ncbi:hypothetical protein GCM10020229_59450 [Kitasatospora albolonga]
MAWAGSPSPWKVRAISERVRGPLTTSTGVPGASGAKAGTTGGRLAAGEDAGVAEGTGVGVGEGGGEAGPSATGGPEAEQADRAPRAAAVASPAAERSTVRRSAFIAASLGSVELPYDSGAPSGPSGPRS